MIRGFQFAKAVWDTLASNYRGTSLIHQCNVDVEQLYALRKTSDVSIDAYISKFSKLYEAVKTFDNINYIRSHEAFIICITRFLRSLPPEFLHFSHSHDHDIQTTKLADVFGTLKIRMGRLHRCRCDSGGKYDSRSWKLAIKDRDTSSLGNATFVLLNFPVLAIFHDATSSTTKSPVVLHVHLHFISASSIRLQSSPGANHHQILTLIPGRIKVITR